MSREHLEERMLDRPVRALQHMLGRLALEDGGLPMVTTDGIFGERTLEAVMVFQRDHPLPVTGVVDRATWNAIRARWLEAEERLAEPRGTRIFPGEGSRVAPGEVREFLIVPQTMFQVLSRHLAGLSAAGADGVHGPLSTENVRWLQRAAGQEETGVLDRAAWEVLSRLYEVFVVQDLEEAGSAFRGGWG